MYAGIGCTATVSTVGSIPDMAPPGGQEDTLLAGSLEEEGMQTGAVVYLADHLLKPPPDIDTTVKSST